MPRLIDVPQPINLKLAGGRKFQLRPGRQQVSDEIANHWMIRPLWAKENSDAPKVKDRGPTILKTPQELEQEAREKAEADKAEADRQAADHRRKLLSSAAEMVEKANGWAVQVNAAPGNAGLRKAHEDAVALFAQFVQDNQLELPEDFIKFDEVKPAAEITEDGEDKKAMSAEDQAAAMEVLKPYIDKTLELSRAFQAMPKNGPKQPRQDAQDAVVRAKAEADAKAAELGVGIDWPK